MSSNIFSYRKKNKKYFNQNEKNLKFLILYNYVPTTKLQQKQLVKDLRVTEATIGNWGIVQRIPVGACHLVLIFLKIPIPRRV